MLTAAAPIGRKRVCRIEPQPLRLLDQWIKSRRPLWDRRLQLRP